MRAATVVGVVSFSTGFIAMVALLLAALWGWAFASMGICIVLAVIFFFGGLQLAFMGMLGEYVVSLVRRSMGRPLVVEAERIGNW